VTQRKQFFLGGLALVGLFGLIALGTWSYDFYNQAQADRKVRVALQSKASVCHTMRNMGISAYAIASARNGFYFPYRECKDFYEILGTKEPALLPESKELEDEQIQKSKAFETKRAADITAGRVKWD
jgi:hypothetical protein